MGDPGSRLTLAGANMYILNTDGSALTNPTVEIRWGSEDGPVLATAAGPSFSIQVTAPANATPGVYFFVAVARGGDGKVGAKAAAQFTVSGGDSSAPAQSEPAAVTEQPAAATPAAPAATGSAPASSSAASSPVASSPAASSPAAAATAPAGSSALLGSATAATGPAARTRSVSVGQAPSAAPAGAAVPAASVAAPVATGAPAPAVSDEATAAVKPIQPAWQPAPAHQPVGLLSDVPPAHAGTPGLVVAMALGMVALFGGGAFLAVARRRQLARSDTH